MDKSKTASVVFTAEELWLIQGVIRHEIAQSEQWRNPPADLDLNDLIAEALLRCHEHELDEAAIQLNLGMCFAIDYCVPQNAKSPSGIPIGKNILMKSFRARKIIKDGADLIVEEPNAPNRIEIDAQLREAGLL